MSSKKQTSIKWLNSNNETICSMLLLDKIPQSIYEQLINCFSMNFERAKEMHEQELKECAETFEMCYYNGSHNDMTFEKYYNETYGNDE